jgi:phenylpropionate dioxygenase-like ring-hydroxylating dioxygenase large terminal subunit
MSARVIPSDHLRPQETPPSAADRVAAAIAAHRPGHALSQPFYCDPAFFEREMERLLLPHWHCVGHRSQLREPGDYFTVDVCGESVIVVCGQDRELRALLNVCRHRGSRICPEPGGHAQGGVFVCPYHAWSYELDGSLRAARQMSPGFDRTKHGLKSAHIRVIEGLIFVSLAATPLGLEHVEDALAGSARVYGWAAAKVAHREMYPVDANWKLAVENYMECYHCAPAHREYSRYHLLARPKAINEEADARVRQRAQALGLAIIEVDHWGLKARPGQESADSVRSSLAEGAVSGSENGGPLAPLMGQFPDFDGGVTFFDVGVTSNFLAYPDHGLIYRFVPKAFDRTDMEVIWLVREDARAGVDYDIEQLTWLWKVTSEADKRIIELNQQGIRSLYYEPGPYSRMEVHTERFVEWILSELR